MRLLKGFWKLLVAVKDALVLLAMLVFFGLLYAALSYSPGPSTVAAKGALLVRLSGMLVEQPADADPIALVAGGAPALREYRLRDVVRALDAAASDSRVSAVVLDLDGFLGGGQAALAQVGAALDRVRAARKPVLAFATGYIDDSYYLAAHADEVWLDPLGGVMVAGPGGSRLYYKGLLDKLGVTAKVYRVGTFKSAVEPFIRSDQSPEARAANQALADALWRDWQVGVARVRPKARIAAAIADPGGNGPTLAEYAVATGLVDKLGDRIAFGKRVAAIAGGDPKADLGFRTIALDRWIDANPAPSGGRVGVLTVAGTIIDGEAPPGTAASETITKLLMQELARGRIKALVVRIDSPGGSVTASERIRSAINEARARKLPVIVSMGSVTASGGYWIASASDLIFADPSTITGSIGVFGIIPTFSGTLEKLGLGADGVRTTPLSGEPNVLSGTSPEFDRIVQHGIEDIYRRFITLVGSARGLSPAQVDTIGQGRVWDGGTAKQIGLVDQFGTVDDAVAEAARRAGLSGSDARPLYIERPPNPIKAFLRDAFAPRDDSESARDAWTLLARAPEARMVQALGDAQAIMTGPVVQARCLECPAPASGQRLTQKDGMIATLLRIVR